MEVLGAMFGASEASSAGSAESSDIKEETPQSKGKAPEQSKEEDPKITEAHKIRRESDALKEIGNSFYRKKEFTEALENYQKAFSLDPSNISILNNEAAVFYEQENYEECIRKCQEAIEKGREIFADYKIIAKALGRMGSAHFKLDNLDEAIKYFGKSLTEHRTPEILSKLQEAEKLKELRAKAAYHSPQIAEEERNKGNELFKAGNYVEAVKHYSEAIKRDEKDARNYANRAACYTKLAAIPEAMKDCDSCIALDPQYPRGYIRKAAVYQFRKEHSKAIEMLQLASSCDASGKHRQEIQQLLSKSYVEMQAQPMNDAAAKEALKDPEVAAIIADPVMQSILQQMQSDPHAISEHMKNPVVAGKIRKLMNAGIVRMA